jgi:hypothetical protein
MTLMDHSIRWLTNPDFDITTTFAVTIYHSSPEIKLDTTTIPTQFPPLPKYPTPPPSTQTFPPKIIYQAITKFQDILCHIHLAANLQSLSVDLETFT